MLKTIIRLSNGREISSGLGTEQAVCRFTWTQCVNEEQELTLGSVCAAMVEIELIAPSGGLSVSEGEEITVMRQSEDGAIYPVGVFLTQKPQQISANRLQITAYDRVSLLDRDLTGWLESLDGWPYALQDFAPMVCEACGVPWKWVTLPNGSYQVEKFQGHGVSGRQLLRWIGEISGRFCRCTPEGELEFAWYTPKDLVVTPSGERFFYQGKLSYSQDWVMPIEKVQIRQNQEDVGTAYPEEIVGANTYIITGNPLMSATAGDSLIGIAQTLYEQLCNVTYCPGKVSLPADFSAEAGDIVTVTDSNGLSIKLYIMTRKQSAGVDTWECTGSPRRDSSGAVNRMSYKNLAGKVLNLKTTVDGLRVENQDMAGKMAGILLDVEGISAEVSRQQSQMDSVSTRLTAVSQSAEAVELRIRQVEESGTRKVTTDTGFTFDEQGLTISKSGTQMENLLNETGMYVKRSGEVILQADQEGVTAVDVTVRNYLMVGEHARLEDYSSGADGKRTACFWI